MHKQEGMCFRVSTQRHISFLVSASDSGQQHCQTPWPPTLLHTPETTGQGPRGHLLRPQLQCGGQSGDEPLGLGLGSRRQVSGEGAGSTRGTETDSSTSTPSKHQTCEERTASTKAKAISTKYAHPLRDHVRMCTYGGCGYPLLSVILVLDHLPHPVVNV